MSKLELLQAAVLLRAEKLRISNALLLNKPSGLGGETRMLTNIMLCRMNGDGWMLTEKEIRYCSIVTHKIERLREFLNSNDLGTPPDPKQWHSFLTDLRAIVGNISNDGSFVASLLAKAFLEEKFGVSFDAAEKPQGAPGIDIEIVTDSGESIAAEIKTTVPYQIIDFGSAQITSLKKDFAKLVASEAEHKYMLVTDQSAFEILKKEKYTRFMPGVRVVNLVSLEEYAA